MTSAIYAKSSPDSGPLATSSGMFSRGVDTAPHVGRKLTWQVPPPQPTVEAERIYRKQRLAAGFRLFARNGYAGGIAGHITARDPEWTDHFWVNPLAVPFSQIRSSDLLLVNDKGDIVEGDGYLNRAAFAIHSELHKANPDIIAAAHAHSLYGKVWSTLGRLLDPITQDSCMFYGDHVLFDDYTGVVEEQSEGARIASALGGHKAAILRNHGLLTVGRSVETAVFWFIAMENAAHAQILAEGVGKTRVLSPEVATQTAKQVGSEFVSWLCFQQQWDVISREEPDLLL